MKQPKITLKYGNGCLWAIIEGKPYGIVSTTGEYKFEHPLSEYFWKPGQDYPLIISELLGEIARRYNTGG